MKGCGAVKQWGSWLQLRRLDWHRSRPVMSVVVGFFFFFLLFVLLSSRHGATVDPNIRKCFCLASPSF